MSHDTDRVAKKKKAEKRVLQKEREIMTRAIEEQTDLSTASLILSTDLINYVENLAVQSGLSMNQARYLSEYAKDGLTGYAAQRAGISLLTVYEWNQNPAFKATHEEVRKLANETLEKRAIDMTDGTYKKPVVSAGKYVCDEEIRDTKMLAMLLRGRMPERYGQRVDVTSGGASLVKLVDRDTWDSV